MGTARIQRSFLSLVATVAGLSAAVANSSASLEELAQTEFVKAGSAMREQLEREAAGDPSGARLAADDAELHRSQYRHLMRDLTGPVLARLVGQTSPQGYVRLHLVVLLVGLAAVVAATHRRFGYRTAQALLVVLAASPVVTVCTEWLGQPDVFHRHARHTTRQVKRITPTIEHPRKPVHSSIRIR